MKVQRIKSKGKRSIVLLIVFSLLLLIFSFQQLYAQEEGEIIVISEHVGEVIDSEERNTYKLFMYVKGFQSAVLGILPDGNYKFIVTSVDEATGVQKTESVFQTEADINQIKEHIESYHTVKTEEYVDNLDYSNTLLVQKQRMFHGATISVETKADQKFKGELLKVMQDSILILTSNSANSHSIDIGDIKTIRIVRSAAPGVVIGIVAGSIFGFIAGREIGEDLHPNSFGNISPAIGALIGLPAGAILGGTVGAFTGKDTIIQIEGESQENIKASLEYLKSKEIKLWPVRNK